MIVYCGHVSVFLFFLQAEDGIRVLVRSRGLGDVYKRQGVGGGDAVDGLAQPVADVVVGEGLGSPVAIGDRRQARVCVIGVGRAVAGHVRQRGPPIGRIVACLLYTSDAADERSSVDLGGRRIIKKTTTGKLVARL